MTNEHLMLKILRQLLKVQNDQLTVLMKLELVSASPLPPEREEEVWLHTEDLMSIYKKSRKTIFNWRKNGRLNYIVKGGTCYYLKSDVYARIDKAWNTEGNPV